MCAREYPAKEAFIWIVRLYNFWYVSSAITHIQVNSNCMLASNTHIHSSTYSHMHGCGNSKRISPNNRPATKYWTNEFIRIRFRIKFHVKHAATENIKNFCEIENEIFPHSFTWACTYTNICVFMCNMHTYRCECIARSREVIKIKCKWK